MCLKSIRCNASMKIVENCTERHNHILVIHFTWVKCPGPGNHTWHYWWIIVLDQFHIFPLYFGRHIFVIQKSNLRLEYLGYLIWVLNDLFVFKHQVSEFTLLIVFFGWILTNQHGRKIYHIELVLTDFIWNVTQLC